MGAHPARRPKNTSNDMKQQNNPALAASRHTVEIMDTTLRDGEQSEGISMMPDEKLLIAKQLLKTLKVDRIEVASARVSEGEHTAVKRIMGWAASEKLSDRVEVLGFVDFNVSVDWV